MRTHIVAYQQQARRQGAAQQLERGQLSRLPTARPAPMKKKRGEGGKRKRKKKKNPLSLGMRSAIASSHRPLRSCKKNMKRKEKNSLSTCVRSDIASFHLYRRRSAPTKRKTKQRIKK